MSYDYCQLLSIYCHRPRTLNSASVKFLSITRSELTARGFPLDVVVVFSLVEGTGVRVGSSHVLGAGVVVVVELNLTLDPGDILRNVSIDPGETRVRAFNAPGHNAAYIPARRLFGVLAEQRPSGVTLEKQRNNLKVQLRFARKVIQVDLAHKMERWLRLRERDGGGWRRNSLFGEPWGPCRAVDDFQLL